jgi:hypothetical protein
MKVTKFSRTMRYPDQLIVNNRGQRQRPRISNWVSSVVLFGLLFTSGWFTQRGMGQNAQYTVCNKNVYEQVRNKHPFYMPFGNGKIKYVIHYHWTDRNYWYAQKLRVAATTRGNVKSGYSVSKNTYNVGSFTVPEFRTSSATITREVDYEGLFHLC